jgi:hypothetical protein
VVLTAESSDGLFPLPMRGPVSASLLRRADVQELVRRLQESHRRLAAQSTRGTWQLVRGSGHVIAEDRPDVVVEAVEGVLRQLRE